MIAGEVDASLRLRWRKQQVVQFERYDYCDER
jgi:hypothetical protein